MTRFVVVPQWQGSPAAGDAPRRRCRGDRRRPAARPHRARRGAAVGGRIARHRHSPLLRARAGGDRRRRSARDGGRGCPGAAGHEPAIVVGGDCGVAVPAIARAAATHEGLAVVWFDAHGDLHSPATSPSGAFAAWRCAPCSMTCRCRLSRTEPGTVPAERGILAGARELDDAESDLLRQGAPMHLAPADLTDPAALADAVTASGATALYIHVDLDVLDPAVITGSPCRCRSACFRAARRGDRGGARAGAAGGSVGRRFRPASAGAAVDDLGTILRVVGGARVIARLGGLAAAGRALRRARRGVGCLDSARAARFADQSARLRVGHDGRWAWGALWSTGRVTRRGGLWVFTGLPGWAFGRGGVCRRVLSHGRAGHRHGAAARGRACARQWRRYGFLMPLLYLVAGRDPLTNRFEIMAGLEDGNYGVPRGS